MPVHNRNRHSQCRGSFHGTCALVFFVLLFFHREEILGNPLLRWSYRFDRYGTVRRKIGDVSFNPSKFCPEIVESVKNSLSTRNPEVCTGLQEHKGYKTKCEFLLANPLCKSVGLFNYIKFFHCDCERFSYMGYVVLAIWLVALFYLLGNTAADYFCCCLEKLSSLLKMSPTVAGVILLPFGNGAPDVFSSLAAFMDTDSGDVGINSVLGGAVFITCVVVGAISLCVADQGNPIDKGCFIRDVSMFLLVLVSLAVILIVGKVSVGGAVAFISIYVVYATFVAANELVRKNEGKRLKLEHLNPLLPVSDGSMNPLGNQDCEAVYTPLVDSNTGNDIPLLQSKVPHWMWLSNVAIYSNELLKESLEESPMHLWGWNDEETLNDNPSLSCSEFCTCLEIPLMLPRRLTIPIVEEERWSKGYAVASVSLAPILLAFLWHTRNHESFSRGRIAYMIGAVFGGILGVLAFIYTKPDRPPQRFLLPWVLVGFFMSIIWFYLIASELVSLLVAIGIILGINPSLLGLTVLAWGNSMGDLMSNVALATNGGDGVQIAMSGCYAGPMFNALAGLGVSMLLAAWSKRPALYTIPRDTSLYFTLGFLVVGLIWSLIILPRSDMRPNKVLGLGLMGIYLVFLCFRVAMALNFGLLDGLS